LERLEQRRGRPLTLVSAPAGYGKTIFVSSWLDQSGMPCTWLSLDEKDYDPYVFTGYFVAAVQKLFPEAFRNTRDLLNAPNLPPLNMLAESLLTELNRIDQAFIIALDDFHLIKKATVHDSVAAMLKSPSLKMHLVIIGRVDPPLPITRLRARSQVTEIRAIDLCFTQAEIKQFLEGQLGLEVDPSTAAMLEEKTEGWVTGLRLAALSMRHRGHIEPALLEPQVTAQYVMEYLFSEVFSHQPKEVRQFLVATAILDRFCGPLCDAICPSEAEPFSCDMGSWEFIDWLKKENLFIVTLDAEN